VGLRPLVCFAKIWYYTTVSNHQYTPLDGKRQTRQLVSDTISDARFEAIDYSAGGHQSPGNANV
jgi:hypothetical protein